jgi:hypothetical protein
MRHPRFRLRTLVVVLLAVWPWIAGGIHLYRYVVWSHHGKAERVYRRRVVASERAAEECRARAAKAPGPLSKAALLRWAEEHDREAAAAQMPAERHARLKQAVGWFW